MARIENLTGRPVLIRLNSGRTLHLPPRQASAELGDVEIKRNPIVEKLRAQRVINLQGTVLGPRSHEMNADEAIARIESTPLEALRGFVSEEHETRKTVLRAWQDKH